ncbi:hypothetical protein, partial [Enhygromyxa salina]|uniref:hypothetical protein n=1 Tax=Enhygromyxa salina TaxID=215803 RepID=UPI00196A0782
MKKSTPLPRASHTNNGTSVPHDELPWPERRGTVLGYRKLHLEQDERPDVYRPALFARCCPTITTWLHSLGMTLRDSRPAELQL